MLDAAIRAARETFSAPMRAVLLKSLGITALLLVVGWFGLEALAQKMVALPNATANTIAKKTVHRSRFRSTSEPPPKALPPPPMPNAPERPASFPEWRRTSTIRMNDTNTWTTSRIASIGADLRE